MCGLADLPEQYRACQPLQQGRASHRAGEKKVVGRHLLHRTASHVRHYGHDRGKKVAVKHLPSKKTVTPKTAS